MLSGGDKGRRKKYGRTEEEGNWPRAGKSAYFLFWAMKLSAEPALNQDSCPALKVWLSGMSSVDPLQFRASSQ